MRSSKFIALFAIFALVPAALFGGWCGTPFGTPPPPQRPFCPFGPSGARTGIESANSCQRCTGSPCYPYSGGYTTDARDLSIQTAGFPMFVSRHYESASAIDTGIGLGWSINLLGRLYMATYLFAAPNTYQQEADVTLPDGSQFRFVLNADGSFTPPPDRYDSLVRNGDGSFDLIVADGSAKYHFDSAGRLATLSDEFGNALTYTYDGGGRLHASPIHQVPADTSTFSMAATAGSAQFRITRGDRSGSRTARTAV